MKRRRFLGLVGGAAAVMAGALWLLGRPFSGRRGVDAPEPGPERAIFPQSALPVLLAVADVIVPRHGDSPAASEIDFVARFEAMLAAAPDHASVYREHFPDFVAAVQRRVPMPAGAPDPELLARLCEHWHSAARSEARPEAAARLFELLRGDVLRVYYASPAGWAFTGFEGPVHWSAAQLAGHG